MKTETTLTLDSEPAEASPAPRSLNEDLLLTGLIELTLGHDEEALATFSSLLHRGETSTLATMCAVQLLLKRRDMVGAETLLAGLLAREPELAEAHYLLGLTYRGMYRTLDAIRSFRSTLALAPEHEKAQGALSELVDVQEP